MTPGWRVFCTGEALGEDGADVLVGMLGAVPVEPGFEGGAVAARGSMVEVSLLLLLVLVLGCGGAGPTIAVPQPAGLKTGRIPSGAIVGRVLSTTSGTAPLPTGAPVAGILAASRPKRIFILL